RTKGVQAAPIGRGRSAVALLARRLRHAPHHPAAWQADDRLSTLAQFRSELKGAAVQIDEILHDRQAKAGATLRAVLGERALAERLHDPGDFFLGDAGARVLDAEHLPAIGGGGQAQCYSPAARRELQRI